jgi:hypothetical protein
MLGRILTLFSRTPRALACAMMAAVVSWMAFAQAPGAITGKLIDLNGNVITGLDASIHMKNTATGVDYEAVVPRDGTYSVTGLPPGQYDMNIPIACCMYRTYDQKSITIKAGETLKMDLNIGWGINLGTIGDDPGMLGNDMRAKAKNVEGPTPRMPDGKPDLSGVWYNIPNPGPFPRFPLQPWAAEIQKKLNELPNASYYQNAASYCLPQSAAPITLPFPYKLVQTKDVIVHIVEFMTPGYRQIFLDGRPHPTEWNPAWMGHSVGTWDGDTLVVDTVGFNEITPGFGIHTEKLHIVERIRRPDKGHLEIELTAEDPDAYTAPYKTTIRAGLVPDEEILEFVCPENNKDPLHFGGLGWKARP